MVTLESWYGECFKNLSVCSQWSLINIQAATKFLDDTGSPGYPSTNPPDPNLVERFRGALEMFPPFEAACQGMYSLSHLLKYDPWKIVALERIKQAFDCSKPHELFADLSAALNEFNAEDQIIIEMWRAIADGDMRPGGRRDTMEHAEGGGLTVSTVPRPAHEVSVMLP